MSLVLDCLRLGVDLAANRAELLAFVNDDEHTKARLSLAHDERTDLQAHTRARLARMREAG